MDSTSTSTKKKKISTKITNKTPFDNNSNSTNSSYSDVPLDSDKNLSTETNVSGTTDETVLQYKFSWFSCCKWTDYFFFIETDNKCSPQRLKNESNAAGSAPVTESSGI